MRAVHPAPAIAGTSVASSPSRPLEPPIRRLLVVDDEEAIRNALGRYLRTQGFDVVTADSGDTALETLAKARFQGMLCDIRMPGMSGLEVTARACEQDQDLAVMMLTGVNDAPTATEALARGAMEYLMKPFELEVLRQAIERALHRRALRIEQRNVERHIREEVVLRADELEREKRALRQLTISVAETLINAMEAKDLYLRGHSQRVADLAASIGEELALDADTIEYLRLAGRLHDVGKIGIRESVLNKPDSLTVDEYLHIQQHVAIGMEILAPLEHLGPALRFIHNHHEHPDGSGYPRGLKGDEISLGGRILCAADAYDALTSRRAYRAPLDPRETLALLGAQCGTLLDPFVFDALRRVVERNQALVFIG